MLASFKPVSRLAALEGPESRTDFILLQAL